MLAWAKWDRVQDADFFSTHVPVQELGSGFGLGFMLGFGFGFMLGFGFGLWFGLGIRVKVIGTFWTGLV